MSRVLRLLISARDPGAANHLLPVIEHLGTAPDFDLRILAAPPADRLFASAGLTFETVIEQGTKLTDRLTKLLADARPDAVLTGLSGPDAGLDEALLAAAGDIPTFAYQDFWGDVNRSFGRSADCYLVRDTYAARLTERRHGVPAMVVGDPRHGTQRQTTAPRQRRKRTATRCVGWCGQPLWEVPGYAASFRTFARQFDTARILVKPHPKETRRQAFGYRRLAPGKQPLIWHGSLERLFDQCDLVASAFSNCALEQAHYNARAGQRPSIAIQLLFDHQLRATYRDWTGMDRLPLAEQGLALGVYHRSMIGPALSQRRLQGFLGKARFKWRHMARPSDAAGRIVELIRHRL